MSDFVYSYHTFLFPFLWKTDGQTKWDDFAKVLSIGRRWVERSWEKETPPDRSSEGAWMQDYAAFQYFTEPANNVIFNTRGDDVTRCFEYLNSGPSMKNRGKYIIEKGDNIWRLDINGIRLHAYDIGVAILILELENSEHTSLEDVNAINEYGRRINMPFLSTSGSIPVCADAIKIMFGEALFSTEDYKSTLNGLKTDFTAAKGNISFNFVMKPIQMLLDDDGSDNGGLTVTTHRDESENDNRKLFIKPCVDDRMFVCCLVRDEALSQKIKAYDVNEREYAYLADCDKRDDSGRIIESTISNELYKLCFIETNVTCQSATMKRQILKDSVYDRWIDYGTLHAVTHHSLICLTGAGDGLQDTVITPFLTEYVQIAILTLAQRAILLLLANEASAVANGFADNDNISQEDIEKIERAQAIYVKAQNQLLLSEITVQEQGVEIYKRMREQLYIFANKQELDEQMNNLRDVANISNDRIERNSDRERADSEKKRADRERQLDIKINVLAIAIGLLAVFEPISLMFASSTNIEGFIWSVLDFAAIVVLIFFWYRKNHKKERH